MQDVNYIGFNITQHLRLDTTKILTVHSALDLMMEFKFSNHIAVSLFSNNVS